MKRVLLGLVCLLLTNCTSSSAHRIGTSSYPPLPATADVLVFTDESQIKRPFEVVGMVSYANSGKFQILTAGDTIEPLKAKAREVGANGIIMGKSQAIKSGFISRGITVDARAVHVAE